MELIILGLKHKETGAYKAFNAECGWRNQTHPPKQFDIKVGETITINQLAPFPFQHFSSLSFDYQDYLLEDWAPCYLKVDGELSQHEFDSMRSAGIMYYRFADRKITLIEEFFDIFQYTKEMIEYFGKALGTYNATTWIIHSEIRNEAERDAMKAILKQASQERGGLDISPDKYTMEYLDYLMELTGVDKFGKPTISFGHYGTTDLSQEEVNAIPLNMDSWLYAFKNITLWHASWFSHPFFTQEVFLKYRDERPDDFDDIMARFNWGVNGMKGILDHVDADLFFEHYVAEATKDWRHKIDDYFYDDETDPDHPLAGVHTLEEFFAMDYPLDHVVYDPFEGYCCEDCDGPLPDDYEDAVEEYDVDNRMRYITAIIRPWDKYITNHGRAALPFISDERFAEIVKELENNARFDDFED